jgi:hypothetical protein
MRWRFSAAGAGRQCAPAAPVRRGWPALKQHMLLGILSAFAIVTCDRITPVEMTHTAIGETFYRIQIYAQKYGAVPASLDALPKREGYVNRTTDGWGRPLEYRVRPDGVITLTSYGRDGAPGGAGDDADISVSYRTKRADGSLWVGSDLWIVEARVKQ